MKKIISIAFFGGIGGLFGSLICLKFFPYLWWLGSIVGFTLSYFLYDFKSLVKVICTIHQKIKSKVSSVLQKSLPTILIYLKRGFNKMPFAVWNYIVFWTSLMFQMYFFLWCLGFTTDLYAPWAVFTDQLVAKEINIDNSFFDASLVIIFTFVTLVVHAFGYGIFLENKFFQKNLFTKSLKPIASCLVAWLIPAILVLVVVLSPIALVVLICIFLFIYSPAIVRTIYTDIRLTVAFGGGIGALGGVFFDGPLVGFLLGALTSLLGYYFIGIKILHINEQKLAT